MSYETFNWLSFWFFIALTFVLFYQSWLNLVKRQLTNFSLDALILLYVRVVRGKAAVAKAKKLLRKEPKRIRMLGIVALANAFVGVYVAIDLYIKYLMVR